MSDDKIYNDTITIESVEQKNDRVTIIAHNKNRYSFWATRKVKDAEGNPVLDQNEQPAIEDSSPMTQFKNMGLRKGSTVKIGFVIEGYTDKLGVNRESKKIINFQETNDTPSQTPPPAESRVSEANRGQSGASRDYDKENVGKCQSLFLTAYLQAGNTFSNTLLQVGQAKKLAEMVVYGHAETVAPDIQETAEQMAREELPVIQQGDDIDVKNIPF